jgi:hypothetical protein
VSSGRSAPVVTALAVASLAVVSLGAMVASGELLVETVDRPARRRLDPSSSTAARSGRAHDGRTHEDLDRGGHGQEQDANA